MNHSILFDPNSINLEAIQLETLPIFSFAVKEGLTSQFIPTKADPLASGYDVCAAKDISIRPYEFFKIPLGFRSFCPAGYYYELHPRSSTFTKRNFHCLVGIVDESWEGETLFAGQYIPDASTMVCKETIDISFGERIGQIIPKQRVEIATATITNEEMDHLFKQRNASRGSGGFGSTGGFGK